MGALKIAVIAVVFFLVAAQVFRIDKTNPSVTADLSAPQPVREMLIRACYDCHSNETVWPWYSAVAPVSWLLAYDVSKGRAALNFSKWGAYSPKVRLKQLAEIREEVGHGAMPPWYYVYPMHFEARLSAADRRTLFAWLDSESGALGQTAP